RVPVIVGGFVEHGLGDVENQHDVDDRRLRNRRLGEGDGRVAEQTEENGGGVDLRRDAHQLEFVFGTEFPIAFDQRGVASNDVASIIKQASAGRVERVAVGVAGDLLRAAGFNDDATGVQA